MALSVKAGFGTGELDPALYERTNLDKYKSGLATLRNTLVGKSGRLVSRMGRSNYRKTKLSDSKSILFGVPYSNLLVEFGHLYIRAHNTGAFTYQEAVHTWTEDDLPNVEFQYTKNNVYIFCAGKKMMVFNLFSGTFLADANIFLVPAAPVYDSDSSSGAGYDVDYVVTYLHEGQESETSLVFTGLKLPIAAGTQNTITFKTPTLLTSAPTEFRIYRRPKDGGAYGFVGSTAKALLSGGVFAATFTDVGSDADYAHSPPTINPLFLAPIQFNPQTGFIYQQRLILTRYDNLESIEAGRPGYLGNFYRDYPLNSSSALTFKAGTSGAANVLRFAEDGGLVVFTTIGIYISSGALSPTNLSLDKKGNWVIDTAVPPLSIPGGLLFLDASTNTVRTLLYSTEAGQYLGDEISIYSNHLFLNRKVTSWAFMDGDIPVVWVTYDDGTFSALTYQRDQEMRAWSRHDSNEINVEQVAVCQGISDSSYAGDFKTRNVAYFIVEKDGERYIERTSDRYVDDEKKFNGADSAVKTYTNLNDAGSEFTLTPDTPDTWDGILTLTATVGTPFANTTENGAAGTHYRIFDEDNSYVDLIVTTYIGANQVKVQPSIAGVNAEVPEGAREDFQLWHTVDTVTGLDHLEGEYPYVYVDGNVVCSPLNDVEEYDQVQVVGGSLTLPDGMRGAVINIGRPFVSDIETLDIDTVEQRPTLLESEQTTKLYLKVYNSRGLYVGNEFPSNDGVVGMEDLEKRMITDVNDTGFDPETIIGNAPVPLTTRREEITTPGEWESQGRVCLRQVDGLPFEILSIIPDSIDMRRIGN